jgi:hypothetical protein
MKSAKLFALAAVLASIIAGHAQAASYFVNITEQSSQQLAVSISFPGYTFDGIVNSAGAAPEQWYLLPLGVPLVQGFSLDNTVWLGEMAWVEPNSNPNNPTYNVFSFGYSGNIGVEYMAVYSDMTAGDFAGTPAIGGFFDGCAGGGLFYQPCPILQNGQTQSGIPLTELTDTYRDAGTMDVTFNDRGDVASAVPEPSTWAMLLIGFAGLGFFAYRGTKKRSAAFAAA